MWPQSAVRAAGFPTSAVLDLVDLGLAGAATCPDTSEDAFAALYADGRLRSTRAVFRAAASPLFREAITWQNPQLVRNWLGASADAGAVTPEAAASAKVRKRVLVLTSYLQRYAMKNDTIGFFGPVGWADWTDGARALEVVTGPELLASRTVYFETWGIEALVDAIGWDPAVSGTLRPRLSRHLLVDASGVVNPQGRTVTLTPVERELMGWCDGTRTIDEIARQVTDPVVGDPAACAAAVLALQERGLVRATPDVVPSAHPERALRFLDDSPSPGHRTLLRDLEAARARIESSAGRPDDLLEALGALDDLFADVARRTPTRRAGQMYAGRTLVYEDAVRAGALRLGDPVREALGPPLGILLRAAGWLVDRAGATFAKEFDAVFDAACQRRGEASLPFGVFVSLVTPLLQSSPRETPATLDACVEEFQQRWAVVWGMAADPARPTLSVADIDELVDELFPPCPVPWARAVHHSPDLMIVAADTAAIERGDFDLVLGEIHLAVNTLEARPFVEQSPVADELRARDLRDHGAGRVVLMPSRASLGVSSRTAPSALLSDDYTYVTMHPDEAVAAPHVLPAAGLRVHRSGDGLVVRSVVDGRELALMEVLGDALSATVMNAFKPVPVRRHNPRRSIDRLIVSRESWSLAAAELEWAGDPDAARRFRGACRWRVENGLPQRCFYSLPDEEKPVFVDFASIPLVELFARHLRRAATRGEGVVVTEMVPDADQSWLHDAAGRVYTAELRLVALAPGAEPRLRC